MMEKSNNLGAYAGDRLFVIRHSSFIRHSGIRHSSFCRPRGIATGSLIVAVVVILALAGIVALLILGQPQPPADDPKYSYSSVELPKMDPPLLLWRQLPVQTGHPRGIAVDAKGTVVWVVGENLELALSPVSSNVGPISLPQPGQCITVDGTRLYVGLKDRVVVVEPDLTLKQWEPLAGTPDISSIACTPDGKHVFVADRGNSVVLHYDGDGKLLGKLGVDEETGKSKYNTKLLRCFDVAMGADGLLRVVDPDKHAIDTYNLDGRLECRLQLPAAGIEGSHGCCNPTDIAMLPGGLIVASEKGTRLPRVKVYDQNAKLDSVIAGPDSFQSDNSLLDLAVDSSGRVYVLDPDKKVVRVYERKVLGSP